MGRDKVTQAEPPCPNGGGPAADKVSQGEPPTRSLNGESARTVPPNAQAVSDWAIRRTQGPHDEHDVRGAS